MIREACRYHRARPSAAVSPVPTRCGKVSIAPLRQAGVWEAEKVALRDELTPAGPSFSCTALAASARSVAVSGSKSWSRAANGPQPEKLAIAAA